MHEKLCKLYAFLYKMLLNPDFLPYWIAALIIFILSLFIGKIWLRNKRSTSYQVVAFSLAISYFFLVLSYTVFSRSSSESWLIEVIPFWSYHDVLFEHDESQLLCILINLAMLAPIGFLFPYWNRNITWKQVLMISAVLAYFIEFSQLLLHKGNFELFDDPIDNIAGCLIGFIIGKAILKRKCSQQ